MTETATKGRVTVETDVVYATVSGRDLLCDVYTPPEEVRNGAAVLLLHGGSWRTGEKSQLRGYGILLGREGYLCVASEYRLLPERWPAQIHDAKAALRWVRSNAVRLRVDPARVAVEGNSAGAHLALLLAGTAGRDDFAGEANLGVSDEVAAVVAVYPPTLLLPSTRTTNEGGRMMQEIFGEGEEGRRAAEAFSPISHAGPHFPPTLLIHGTADKTVPHRASMLMFDKLHEAGVPVDLHLFAEQPHAFDIKPGFGRLCATEMALFLSRYMPTEQD